MSCSNSISVARFYNTNSQAIAASTSMPIVTNGTQVVLKGSAITPATSGYVIQKYGTYDISIDVTILGILAGAVGLTVLLDGVALPCMAKTITLDAGGYANVHSETTLDFTKICKCAVNVPHTIQFVLTNTGAATGTIVSVCSGITKLE